MAFTYLSIDDLKHEVQALLEVRDVSQQELRSYLMADHPTGDINEKISQLRGVIADIEYLIADVQAQIASRELYQHFMREYAMVHSMNLVSI
jgi:hypothetical protein